MVLLVHAGFPYTVSADRQAHPCRKTRSAVCVRSTLTMAPACPALSFAVTSYGADPGNQRRRGHGGGQRDLEAAGGFIYRTLNGGGHLSIVQLSPVKHPGHAAWRRAFLNVLTAAGDAIPGDAIIRPLQPDTSVERVVFIVHGIRDYGAWTTTVAGEVTRLSGGRAVQRTPSYDYFPMGRSLSLRRPATECPLVYGPIHRSSRHLSEGTVQLYRAQQRHVPSGERAASLQDAAFRSGRLRWDGLPRSFPWERFVATGRVAAIQNYVATADWVVGWFPGFFQWVVGLFGREPDIGSGGHNGFLENCAHLHAIDDTFAAVTERRLRRTTWSISPASLSVRTLLRKWCPI